MEGVKASSSALDASKDASIGRIEVVKIPGAPEETLGRTPAIVPRLKPYSMDPEASAQQKM